jgi:hypothetical protein
MPTTNELRVIRACAIYRAVERRVDFEFGDKDGKPAPEIVAAAVQIYCADLIANALGALPPDY